MADFIPRPQLFNPRDRLHNQGMTRPPVGMSLPTTAAEIAASERGRTLPITVTNVSQELIPADPDRKFIYLVNYDALGIVWVFFGGGGAIVGQGVRLGPGGGGILLDNNVPTARVFMIGTIANNPNVTAVLA